MFRLLVVITLVLSAFTKVDAITESDIQFFLSNRIFSYEEFTRGDYSHLNLDNTKEVKIICHGWVSSASNAWYTEAKRQYDIRGRTNVIGVDWSSHANGLYSSAVRHVESVGYYIALLVTDMSKNLQIPINQFHIVGHSLGAHIGGYAGQYVQAIKGEKIGRITGLDPARPQFEDNHPEARLSDDDAIFVDVMHTDAGTLGYVGSIGHVDYFPNGGSKQNGCGILITSICSHNRAPSFFYESITSNRFIAVACSSARDFNSGNCQHNHHIIMGEEVDQSARGDFYLNTASSSPYALG